MKIFAISDLHLSAKVDKPMDIFGGAWDNYWDVIKNNWVKNVADEDIVLMEGDISWAMFLSDAVPDLEDIASLPGRKLMLKGNHDYWWGSLSKVKAILPPSISVIQNDALRVDGYVIFGSRGWTCPDKKWTEEDQKIYNRESERLKLSVKSAKAIMQEGDKLIGMMHFPPFNTLREDSLFTEIFEKEDVRTVVYGHLHGKNCRVSPKVIKNGVEYYLTSCDQINNALLRIF